MNIWAVSSYCWVEIKLLWTFVNKPSYGPTVLFPLSEYLGVELLDYMVSACLVLYDIAKLLSKLAVPFYIPTTSLREF